MYFCDEANAHHEVMIKALNRAAWLTSVEVRFAHVVELGSLTRELGITTVPTLTLIADGKELGRVVGVQSTHGIVTFIESSLKGAGTPINGGVSDE
jgi:thioredoxin-like negative regulator of GroEL